MENELKTNARKVGKEAQYEIRKTIIRMLKNGKKGKEIAKDLGVSEGHVSNIKKAYEKDGIAGIKIGRRGRQKGAKRILNSSEEKEIQRIIVDKTPDQLKFKECMWTRNNIRQLNNILQLIKEKYGIDIKLSTLGYYLARWGFSVQRPVKRAYEQDQKKIDKWLNEEFPGINERAEAENAEIFFGDETNIQNTANYMRGYAPKGQTTICAAMLLKVKHLLLKQKQRNLKSICCQPFQSEENFVLFFTRII